jgi:hypothetical protein
MVHEHANEDGLLVAQDFAGEREEVDADWEKSRSKVQSPKYNSIAIPPLHTPTMDIK